MTLWLILISAYWFTSVMTGTYPIHRMRQSSRFRNRALTQRTGDKRIREQGPEFSELSIGQPEAVEARWARRHRFGWPVALAATVSYVYALVLAGELGAEGLDGSRRAALWASSLTMTAASMAFVGLIAYRYRRGVAQPFTGSSIREKVAYGATSVAAIVAVMIYANASV